MTTSLLATRLESWHRTAILEHPTAQEFAHAFIASGDADGLEDGWDAIEAACRSAYAELQAEAVATHEAQLIDALEPIYRTLAERGLPPFAEDMAGLRARLMRLHIKALEQAGVRHLDAAESAERCREEAKQRAFALVG